MPRNRRSRDRDEKFSEIVTAATGLFTELGFEHSSMNRIAQAAGVTPNTIYWYVDDKDALLVAVLDRLLADALGELGAAADVADLVDQVGWTLDYLQRRRNLVNVVHTRAEQSEVVATWHTGFHTLMDGFVIDGLLRQGVAEHEVQTRASLTTYAVEGLLAHPTDPASARAVLELTLRPGR